MKKTIIVICFIFFLTACQEEFEDNSISKITERTMYEKRTTENMTNLEKPIEKVEPKEESEEPKEDIIPKVEITEAKTEPKEEVIDPNEVDPSNPDYLIHQGRIDCLTIDECMNIAIPIQYELNNSIDNVTYLEVKNKLNNLLGYFITYTFKDYQYSDYDECLMKETYLNEVLINQISSSTCYEDGTLVINHGGEAND